MCEEAKRALLAWTWPEKPRLQSIMDGLINQTFVVSTKDGPMAVLQQLNTAVFVPEVHEDIEAVTSHLASAGIRTPRLIRTDAGTLWHVAQNAGVWRCMTYEGDRTIHKVTDRRHALEAGGLAARFHAAVRDMDWTFRSVRAGAHDTPKHMHLLEESLARHVAHRLFDDVASLAEEILERWRGWERPGDLARRVIHGDLKISNVRYLGDRAHCLIDLDTMARDTLDVELGDAMRSWCNPASEDALDTEFDLGTFESAMLGYAGGVGEGAGPSAEEWGGIVPGIERITLELAARFARDALEESYFGWNERFGTRGDHNLLRARGQLALARSLRAKRDAARRIVDTAWTTVRD